MTLFLTPHVSIVTGPIRRRLLSECSGGQISNDGMFSGSLGCPPAGDRLLDAALDAVEVDRHRLRRGFAVAGDERIQDPPVIGRGDRWVCRGQAKVGADAGQDLPEGLEEGHDQGVAQGPVEHLVKDAVVFRKLLPCRTASLPGWSKLLDDGLVVGL